MKIKREVLEVLDRSTFDGQAMRLPEQLERKLYLDVAKVVEAAGGKWSKKAKAHLFEEIAADAIEPVILTGEVTSRRQEFEQFYTPPDIVKLIIEVADVRPGMLVLEPSAGRGAIAFAALANGAHVDCVELDQKNVAHLREHDALVGKVRCGDFLDVQPIPCYQRVLMNSPFAKRADVHHVTHAAKFLTHSGRLVAIMSAGVAFRQDKLTKEFRLLVEDRCGSIVPLPEDSFKSSGTSVNTVIVQFGGMRR